MKVEQLSIFLENKAGRLAKVTQVLANAGIDLRALSLADTSDFGILRLIVDDTKRAMELLKAAGYTVGQTSVVAVEVENVPGGLNHILQTVCSDGINVEYMYAFVQSGGKNATMIFRFNHTEQAIAVLQSKGIPIISAEQINGR